MFFHRILGLLAHISESNQRVKLFSSSIGHCIEVDDNVTLNCLHPPLTREGFKPTVQWEVNGEDVELGSGGFAETHKSTVSILTWNVNTSDSLQLNFSCYLIQESPLEHVHSNYVLINIQSRGKIILNCIN